MKIKHFFLGLLIFSFLTSCTSGIKKILKAGYIEQHNFKKVIPFTYTKTGHILLKVTVKGKVYDFILDTGATTIISEEVAEELNVKTIGVSEIEDINNKKANLNFVSLENIQIGGIDFKNTIGSILDLKKGELACLEVDGLIGANLMRHAVWDFDFKRNIITITNDESQLDIPENYSESKIYVGDAYQASIITEFNNKRVLNNVIDLGNSADARLSYKVFEKLKESEDLPYVKGSGGSGFGAFGRSIEKKNSYKAKMNTLKIGNIELKNLIVDVKDGSTNLGLSVFKNSRIIFNWGKKSLKMIQQSDREPDSVVGFGFYPVFENNKMYVNYLYEHTEASKLLKYRDQIVSINNKSYASVSEEEWCKMLQNGLPYKNKEVIKIKVLREGKELSFELKKIQLL